MAGNNICLPFFIILVVAVTLCASFAAPPSHCPNKCGNVSIEYPFGIGEECSFSVDFTLRCVLDEGIDYTVYRSRVILQISQTQMILRSFSLVKSCPDDNSSDHFIRPSVESVRFKGIGSSYVLSSKENAFMIIGCNYYTLIHANTTGGRKLTNCVSICGDSKDLEENSCSGVGCCQATLPKGLQTFIATMSSIPPHPSFNGFNCSYALIVKKSSFSFRRASEVGLPGFEEKLKKLPMVLDWFIPNNTCREYFQNKTAHICKQNSLCVDVKEELGVYGYRCECLPGFKGNSYIDGDGGCKDIDECKEPSNPCSHTCTNTNGSFICSCPRGYQIEEGTFHCFPKKMSIVLPIGLGVAFGTLLFLVAGYWIFIFAKKRRQAMEKARNFKRNGGLLLLKQQPSSSQGMIERTRLFTQTELAKATDNFSEDRILGRGGQGTVYKGMLSGGDLVAIKKHKLGDQTQLDEFVNEIAILSAINHRNIVRLLGCCLETDVPLLVYEYIVNGALSKLLHQPQDDYPITWPMRLGIALDVAGAIYHLHSSASSLVLHKDVKTDNILLDEKYRAKLSDFGTSRSIDVEKSHLTTQVKGTFGYFDPEYHKTGQYSDRSDVYSFGVVILELLTGKKAVYQTESGDWENLALSFKEAMRRSTFQEMLAAEVANEASEDTVTAITNLASQCLNEDRMQRPTMRDVQLELEAIIRQQGTAAAAVSFLRPLPVIPEGTSSGSVDVSDDDDDSDGEIHPASD